MDWAAWSLIIKTGCGVQVYSLILVCSVGLSMGIQCAGDSVPETLVQILHSAEEDNLFHFHLKIVCLCQSIEINIKTCISLEPGAKPNGSGVEWAECSLIIGTGFWVRGFSLDLDSSVGLSAGIQSAWNSVPKTLIQILHSAEEDNLSPSDLKIACLCQSIEINKKKHVYHQRQVRKPNGSGVEWAECLLIIGTGCWVQVFSLILDSSVVFSAGIQSAGDSVTKTLIQILHSAEVVDLSPFDL